MDTKVESIFLRGKKVNLRPVRREEIPLYAKWINDPDVRIFLNNTFPFTFEAEEKAYEKMSARDPNNVILAIETRRGELIGLMGIHNIDWVNRTATTGTNIGDKKYWGKGYGTDAKMTLLDYCFNTLGLHRINSTAIAYNERSVRYSLRCGYKIEGRLREQYFRKGARYDSVMLGVLREEWLPLWLRYQKTGRVK